MKLKNTLFLLLVIAFVVAVAGCSSDNNGNGVQQVKTSTEPQTSPQAQATPAATPDVKGSFKNPAGINEVVTLESTGSTYDFSVVKVIRGTQANSIVRGANEFNEKPATGYEYLLVDNKVAYTKGEESAYLSYLNFKAYCESVECKSPIVVLPTDYIKFDGGNVMPSVRAA
jgi:hypothetical protein